MYVNIINKILEYIHNKYGKLYKNQYKCYKMLMIIKNIL